MKFLQEMIKINENAGKRYLGINNDGDGPTYRVFNDPKQAYEYVESASQFAEIIEFTGEVISIEMSGRGETILNDERGTHQIFHKENDEVYTDELGLAS
jgi:hypothetical protein